MSTCLLWLRRDLRIADNPALHALLKHGHRPIPVYIYDEPDPDWPLGSASAWWLHHSLTALKKSLQHVGSDLIILTGDAEQQLLQLIDNVGAKAIYWNRCYEPAYIKRDQGLKKRFKQQGITCHSFNGSLFREPWEHLKKDGSPYRVFTPFWKSLHERGPARDGAETPTNLPAIPEKLKSKGTSIESLNLLPASHWDSAFYEHWQPGEIGAWKSINDFFDNDLSSYPTLRDLPEKAATSSLSAHLHFGEISPIQIWDHILQFTSVNLSSSVYSASEAWLRQLGWREFSVHLLYHFPHTALQPLDKRFEQFQWQADFQEELARWQQGQTGIPLVDAGMRQLWTTGGIHNRVRMVVASFLTKNLRIPWQQGARWFWDTLVDADLANNTMGWQWTAGSGVDASPYFRIFNPVLQGEKFDKTGNYVRHWLPELANLGNKFIHQPWSADHTALSQADIKLGVDYPYPMIDLASSRKDALLAWNRVKQKSA